MKRTTKLFLTMIIIYGFSTEFLHSTNEFSRFSLTMSIADNQTFSIDGNYYYRNFPDYFHDRLEIDGKAYSDKPPGPSIISVPAYVVMEYSNFDTLITVPSYGAEILGMKTLRSEITRPFLMEFLVILSTSGLLCSCLVVLFFCFCRSFIDENYAIFLSLVLGLGTTLSLFATSLFDTVFTSFFLFFPIYLVKKKRSHLTLLLSGLSLGWAAISNYYAIIFVILITLYIMKSKRDLLVLLLPILFFLSVFLYYNTSITGSIFDFAYTHHVMQLEGIIKVPDISSVGNVLFDLGKLVFYSPFILITLYMFSKKWPERFLVCSIIISCVLFLFTSTSRNPRFFAPIMPFFVLPLIWFDKTKKRFVFLLGTLSILLISLLNSTASAHSTFLDINPSFLMNGQLENIISVSAASVGLSAGWFSVIPVIATISIIWKNELFRLFRLFSGKFIQ